jgi:hypothetical protein
VAAAKSSPKTVRIFVDNSLGLYPKKSHAILGVRTAWHASGSLWFFRRLSDVHSEI